MTDQPKKGRVRIAPRGAPPEGYKRLPSLSQRIASLASPGDQQEKRTMPAERPGDLKKGLGAPSKITRAVRTTPDDGETPESRALKQQFLNRINSNLNAKSGLPTLAQRIAREGVEAQLGRGPKMPIGKRRKQRASERAAAEKTKGKRAAKPAGDSNG